MILKNSLHSYFKYFFSLSLSPSSSGIPITHILYFYKLSTVLVWCLSFQTVLFFLPYCVLCNFCWNLDILYQNKNWGKWALKVRVWINLARSWAVFNICCICRCQRFQMPLVCFCLLYWLRDSLLRESLNLTTLNCDPQLLCWSPVDVLRAGYGAGAIL